MLDESTDLLGSAVDYGMPVFSDGCEDVGARCVVWRQGADTLWCAFEEDLNVLFQDLEVLVALGLPGGFGSTW